MSIVSDEWAAAIPQNACLAEESEGACASSSRSKSDKVFLGRQGDAVVWLRHCTADFCILQVSRGMGPRALEQWLWHGGGTAQIWPNDNGACQPRVRSPYYRAYLTSLVLVEKVHVITKKKKKKNDEPNDSSVQCQDNIDKDPSTTSFSFSLTIHALIQGRPNDTQLAQLRDEDHVDVEILRSVSSNTAGLLSLASLTASRNVLWNAVEQQSVKLYFRNRLKERTGCWILGQAEGSRSFRGHRLLMSAVQLRVECIKRQHNGTESTVIHAEVNTESPTLFSNIMDREERFWLRRHAQVVETNPEMDVHQHESSSRHAHHVPPPRAYQEGFAHFGDLRFIVSPAVMIPRPASLTLVSSAQALWNNLYPSTTTQSRPEEDMVIMDLGTGSGSLLVTLLKQVFPHARCGYGVDISCEALVVAQANAEALLDTTTGRAPQCHFLEASFTDVTCPEPVDLFVCNPPYHVSGRQLEATTMQYEPRQALFVDTDNSKDGLVAYRQAWSAVTRLAAPGAVVVFEVCRDNATAVYEYLVAHGLQQSSWSKDSKGFVRSVQGKVA